MLKNRFNWFVNLILLPLALWVAGTGLVAELFDINDFVWHKYPAFLLAALLAMHFLLRLTPWISGTRHLLTFRTPASTQARPSGTLTSSAGITRRNLLLWLGSAIGGFLAGNLIAPTRWASLPPDEDIGDVYHRWSKPGNVSLISTAIDWGTQPPLYKDYPSSAKFPLPAVTSRDGLSVERAIAQRRSVRDYAGSLSLEELSHLVYHSSGLTKRAEGDTHRANPSSGALYPIETYLIVHNVTGLNPGVYHYNVRDHALDQVQAGDFRQAIVDAALNQEFFGKANVVFVLTSIFQRARWKYQDRTYRYALLEAGHIGQNVYLNAQALGLGACGVGAFWDDDVNRLVQVDGKEEATVYLLTVGRT